ncbi:hypothetical protein OSTOST_00116 [Ostertagia ostertagi]
MISQQIEFIRGISDEGQIESNRVAISIKRTACAPAAPHEAHRERGAMFRGCFDETSTSCNVVVWFLVIVVSLETIIGNAMVVIAYKIERSIGRKVSNRYIASLAISDLIIGIEGFPFFTVYVLNVCHTASYLKWQTPAKTQVLIILSWLLPALIFGVMMYGWDTITGVESMTTSECSAPFLSNPYVNMGMYLVYYWTTLIAMLILYKGIHQAAKSLEKKAKAKEQRNMALLLGQRLGTQVGVTLMLHSKNNKGAQDGPQRSNSEKRSLEPDPQSRRLLHRNGTGESEQIRKNY